MCYQCYIHIFIISFIYYSIIKYTIYCQYVSIKKLRTSFDARSVIYGAMKFNAFFLLRDQNLVNDMDYAIGCLNIGNDHVRFIDHYSSVKADSYHCSVCSGN